MTKPLGLLVSAGCRPPSRSRSAIGAGMTEVVLSNALLPFYSTKRGGTGLGLVREIAEAHGDRVALAVRDGGGMTVTMTLPQ